MVIVNNNIVLSIKVAILKLCYIWIPLEWAWPKLGLGMVLEVREQQLTKCLPTVNIGLTTSKLIKFKHHGQKSIFSTTPV